jgi:hypothetical protein
MANKIIDLTGDQIESALGVVHNADGAPTAGSPNHVNSGNIHTFVTAAIDGSLNNGPKITASTFNATTLVDSLDTLATNVDDEKLATTLAIKNYVQAQPMVTVSNASLPTLSGTWTVVNDSTNATINTTATSGSNGTINVVANTGAKYFIVGQYQLDSDDPVVNVFDFFDASNLDVLANLSGLRFANLTIIRFA